MSDIKVRGDSSPRTPRRTVSYRGRKMKGDRAEREVVDMLRPELGDAVSRQRSSTEDRGDIALPSCTIQVKSYADVARAIRLGLADAQEQKERAGTDYAAAFIRRPGGSFVVAMTPEDWLALYKEAMSSRER